MLIFGLASDRLPHAAFGNRDCCGGLKANVSGERAEISCDKCGTVIAIVPVKDLAPILLEMELSVDLAAEDCPHCETA